MLSSAVRLAVFVPFAVWMSGQADFVLERVWYLSVATVWLQGCVSYLLMRGQFKRRLAVAIIAPAPAVATAESHG